MSQRSSKKSASSRKSSSSTKAGGKEEGYENIGNVVSNAKAEAGHLSSIVADVTRKYMDLKDLTVDFVQGMFRKWPETLAYCGDHASEIGATLTRKGQEYIAAMTDLRAITESNGIHTAGLFATASVFLFVSAIGEFVGAYIASYLLAYFLLDIGVLLLVVLVIPAFAHYYFFVLNGRGQSDEHRRVLASTLVFEQAVLIGFFNRYDHLQTPYLVVMQIIISFVYPIALLHTDKREGVLGAVVGASVAGQFIIGGILNTVTTGFLLMSTIDALLAAAFIQYVLTFRKRGEFDDAYVPLAYVFVLNSFKMLTLNMFGSK